LESHNLGSVVVHNREENLFLFFLVYDALGASYFVAEVLGYVLRSVDHLLLLFHFEFLDKLEGGLLIVSHVPVPGLLEFSELGLLSSFNVH
jgi:hypothetical protein